MQSKRYAQASEPVFAIWLLIMLFDGLVFLTNHYDDVLIAGCPGVGVELAKVGACAREQTVLDPAI